MTATPTIGAADLPPVADETVPPGSADGEAGHKGGNRRRLKLVVLLFLLGLFALLLGLAIWYLLFRQPIPLPTLPGQTVMPTYSAAINGPDRPMGVAVTADGSRVFIGETEGERTARVFDSAGTELGQMQPPVSTGAEHVPVYLAMHPTNGEIYVTDRPTGSVFIYDANGTYQREYNPGADLEGWQPLGIAFDSAGNLYVTDVSVQPQRVLVFDPSGALVRTAGKTAGMSFPNGVAVDDAGNIYVTDANNGRLLVIDASDQVVASVGRGVGEGNLGLPRGVATDDKGRVYVADATSQAVFVYGTYVPGERSLQFLGSFGGEGVANGAFLYPNGVTVDGRGRVYVTDAGNDRVQIWSY